jgi:BR serine/threonine kinase
LIFKFLFFANLGILRPSSPASANSPARHSSARLKNQINDTFSTPTHVSSNNNNLLTTSSCTTSPVHHRASSGPIIIPNNFCDNDPMVKSAILPPQAGSHMNQMDANGSGTSGSQLWKTRLTNIKNSFLGSPRFHRRKMQSE